LLSHLAWGSTAELVRARRLNDGATVVLKLLAPHLRGMGPAAARLLAEGEVGKSLDHRGFARVLDLGTWAGVPYLVLEALEGVDAEELGRVWGAWLPRTELLAFGEELALALAHLHARGWVHRDVSPRNVILADTGSVKLLDLGLVAPFGTASDAVVGTVAYAAPEQVSGGCVDGRADVFSLGVILHELFTGRRLFASGTEAGTLLAVCDAPIPRLRERCPDLCEDVECVVMRALEREPSLRWRTAEEFAWALRRARGEQRPDLVGLARETRARSLAVAQPRKSRPAQ
jgi:serine/threonine protein kinase